MKKQRRKHTARFRSRVAFEAIQGLKTQTEITRTKKTGNKDKKILQRKVGQLTMEVEFLEKKCEQLGTEVSRFLMIVIFNQPWQ